MNDGIAVRFAYPCLSVYVYTFIHLQICIIAYTVTYYITCLPTVVKTLVHTVLHTLLNTILNTLSYTSSHLLLHTLMNCAITYDVLTQMLLQKLLHVLLHTLSKTLFRTLHAWTVKFEMQFRAYEPLLPKTSQSSVWWCEYIGSWMCKAEDCPARLGKNFRMLNG